MPWPRLSGIHAECVCLQIVAPVTGQLRLRKRHTVRVPIGKSEQQSKGRHQATVLGKMRLHDWCNFFAPDALLQVGKPLLE